MSNVSRPIVSKLWLRFLDGKAKDINDVTQIFIQG